MDNILDLTCAKSGNKICKQFLEYGAKEAENLLRKSLGVLQEMGLYAHFLFIGSQKSDKNPGKDKAINSIIKCEVELLNKTGLLVQELSTKINNNFFNNFSKSFENSTGALYASKEILERTLTYALFEIRSTTEQDT